MAGLLLLERLFLGTTSSGGGGDGEDAAARIGSSSSDNSGGTTDLRPVEVLATGTHSRLILCAGADDRPVLLKATRISVADRAATERLVREINLACAAMSEFVVASAGWCATPELEVYVQLSYCPGGDVGLLVDREGALSPQSARFYAGCLALAGWF